MRARKALLRDGARILAAAGIDGPMREARLLMRWAGGLDGAALDDALEMPPGPEEMARWRDGLARRSRRAPFSHVVGRRRFWGREFRVGPDVLDPRPETETLIGEALRRGPFRRLLDLGTGSGCILLTLLAEWPEATGLGIDVSPGALACARSNAIALGVADRVDLREGDWLEGVNGRFDLIACNPPYVAADEMPTLAPEVRDHEPHVALTPGGDGLDAYRRIAGDMPARLDGDGLALFEIGPAREREVGGILAAAGLAVEAIVPDLDRRARVVVARRQALS